MKKIVVSSITALLAVHLLAGMVLLSGCATWTKQDTCVWATTAYATYLAVINSGGQPTDAQIKAAIVASATLEAYCGWTDDGPKPAVYASPPVDHNGVRKVCPR